MNTPTSMCSNITFKNFKIVRKTKRFRPPKILLEKSRGLSNATLIQLQTDLENLAQDLKGEVMIFELAQFVQVFLHKHNKPGAKSFYDEMLLLKQEKEKEEQKKKYKAVHIVVYKALRQFLNLLFNF